MSSMDYERWSDLVDRETSGEILSEEERAFAREFEGSDELARAEAEIFAALSGAADPEEAPGALVERAVAAALARHADAARASRRRIATTGLVFAAAAGAALWFSHAEGPAREPVAALPSSTVEYLDGQVTVDGRAAQNGARVGAGVEVAVTSGVACVAVEPTVHVCAGAGSKLRVRSAFGPEKEVELVEGSLATALAPLPAGQHYSIVSGATRVTAVGTAFTVQRLGADVKTIVHEGKVRVGDVATGQLVTAHKIGLSTASGISVEALTDHRPTETPEWEALARVAHRSIEGEMSTPAPAAAPAAPAVEAPASTRVGPAPAEPKARAPEAPQAPAPTAADLLARARQALRGQSWQEAAGAYRELIEAYPSSPEARAALVPLAGLEIDRLGQPAVALQHLDAYLAAPGALSMEAELAQIRALRALGRTADEARAIDEFLTEHPSSLEAPRLRERRDALSR